MKYIVIVSVKGDTSTNMVIEWLNLFNHKVLRIDLEDLFNLTNVNITNKGYSFDFIINGKKINSKKIKSFWFRQGNINLKFSVNNKKKTN